MSISNTSILIKRSSANTAPSTLKSGELAVSYVSNVLYLGNSTGTGVVNVGGQFYTSQIDNATQSNTAGTLVKRDPSGSIYGQFYGTSNAAVILQTSQNFSISGSDITATNVGFNGSGAVTLNASLNAVPGLGSGSIGSATAIPIITYAANGRIIAVSSAAASSNLIISDGTTSNTINPGVTFYHKGGGGVTATVSANTVTFGTDTTVVRSNTVLVGPQTISTDLVVSGNLTVTGAQTYVNTSTFQVNDSLFELAANNTINDIIDIGFYGASNTGAATVYHGLIREGSGGTSAGNFYLFKNLPTNPTGNTVAYGSLSKASLIADLSLSTGYPTSSLTGLGTGVATWLGAPTAANLLAATLANTGTGNLVFATSPTLTTPVIGAATGTSLSVTGQLTSTIAQGTAPLVVSSGTQVANMNVAWSGTSTNANNINGGVAGSLPYQTGAGATALLPIGATGNVLTVVAGVPAWVAATGGFANPMTTTGDIIYSNPGSTPVRLPIGSSTQVLTVTGGVPVWATPASGGMTNPMTANGDIIIGGAGGTAIRLGAGTTNQVLTIQAGNPNPAWGTITGLTVAQGGTGFATAATNGIVFGNGTSALGVTAAAGVSDQTWSNQILTVNNSGQPQFANSLDGGQF